MALMCAECGLVYVRFVRADLVVTGTEVQVGKYDLTVQLNEELINNGDEEGILDGCCINRSIIHTKTPKRVAFSHQ